MIKNLSGVQWATDILYGKKPIPTYSHKHHDNGEFKKLLDAEMEKKHKVKP